MKKIELLVPAGSKEAFIAAVNHGADAIYLAGKMYGARSFAPNFTNEELKEVITLGKIYGVKVYVAMNTLIKEEEVESFLQQVEFLYHHGVDAIIMQDFGMICLCREKYPNLEIHASTQCNSSTIETIELLAKLGIKRVVLPRELTKEEIASIKTPIEIEVFIHGALCVSYSGCCLFSQRLGGRSGNRGECAGSCRLPYALYDGDQKIKEGYLLSMKELNLSEDILSLPDNVTSLKIEGRMKSASYVAFITSYYRQILDGKSITLSQKEDLQSLFYREFTKGHMFSSTDLINDKSPNHIGLSIGKVIQVNEDKIIIKLTKELHQGDGIRFMESKKGMMVNFLYDQKDNLISKGNIGQIVWVDNKIHLTKLDTVHKTTNHLLEITEKTITKKIPISIEVIAHKNTPLKVIFEDDKHHVVSQTIGMVELSQNMPITKETIKKQLSKLGNTPFKSIAIDIDMDEDIFIRIGDLNIIRRILSERLIGVRMNDYSLPVVKEVTFEKIEKVEKLDNLDKYIWVPRNCFISPKQIIQPCAISEIRDVHGFNAIGTYHLNVYNSYSAYYLYQLGFKAITLSVELNKEELISVIKSVRTKFGVIPLVIKTKGKIEVMVIKNNILGIEPNKEYRLADKLHHHFPVIFDGRLTHIYSHDEMNMVMNESFEQVYTH